MAKFATVVLVPVNIEVEAVDYANAKDKAVTVGKTLLPGKMSDKYPLNVLESKLIEGELPPPPPRKSVG